MSAATKRNVRVIMVGAPKVGKTALLQRYNDLDFEPLYIPTSAGDFSVKDIKIDSDDVSAQIWDIGGCGVLGKSFLRGTHGVILTIDLTSKASMKVLDNVYNRVKQLVGFIDDAFPCALVGTKFDLTENGGTTTREICTADLKSWADGRRVNSEDPIIIYEVSAKDGKNVTALFESILRWAKNKPGKVGSAFTASNMAISGGVGQQGTIAILSPNKESYNYAQTASLPMYGEMTSTSRCKTIGNNSVDLLNYNPDGGDESDQAVALVLFQ